jgi:hypothetical protein
MNQKQTANTCDICKSLIKTYNAFLVDELPEDLKEACWSKASNCCEGDECSNSNTKIVLMKLIENHKNKSTFKSENIDGVFKLYWHPEYKKLIYIFRDDTKEYLNRLVDNPIAFIDVYIKEFKNDSKEIIEQPKLAQIHFTNNFIKPNNALFNFLNEALHNFTLLNKEEIVPEHIENLLRFCDKHESVLQIFMEKDDNKFINFWKSQIITDVLLKGVIENVKPKIYKFFRYELVLEILKLRSIFFHTSKTILELISNKTTIPEITPTTYLRITRMLFNNALKINQIISNFYIMSDMFKIFDSHNDRPNQAYNIIIYLPNSIDVAKYQMFLETFGFTEIEN